MTHSRDGIQNGAIPYFVIVLTQLLLIFTALLATALMTESVGGTAGAMVVCNLVLNFSMTYLSKIPEFETNMKGDTIVWSALVMGILLAEFSAIVLILAITFYCQSRKKDFI